MIQNDETMIVLGITGGIGSGKSLVLHQLEQVPGAVVIEADLLAHKLMLPGHVAYRRIVECFGREILSGDGTIDRTKLGSLVFQDEEALRKLDHIVHPEVKKSIRARIRRNRRKETRLLVIEAALLIQDGYKTICDEIWYIYTKPELRIQRLLESRGGTPVKWRSVISSQPEDAFFLQNADVVLENNADETALRQNLIHELERLLLKSEKNDDIIS